jgi:pilus assembly protein CpaC
MKSWAVALLLSFSLAGWGAPADLPSEVSMSIGESRLLLADVRRAALGSGKVVSIATPERGQFLLVGEGAGVTTAQLWLRDGRQHVIQVRVVDQDLTGRLSQVQALLADVANVSARINGGFVLLEGQRASADEQSRAAEVAALFPGQVLNFVGTSGWESMVQLHVRLVEVRRDQLRELGLRWDGSAAGPSVSISLGGDADKLSAGVQAATLLQSRLDLLQQRGLAYTVAEPTLSCRSGGVARFVSGGEIPIPISDGLGSTDVQYKEYGVILEVRPQMDRSGTIRADIDIEMSQIDSSVRVGDYPGFVKRRASTAFNAMAGETIAIAGLVSREQSRDRQGIPGLSSVPAVGALFRSTRRLERETELLVLITATSFQSGSRLEPVIAPEQNELIERGQQLVQPRSAP